MSWDEMKKAKEEGGGGKFIKLKDGDAIEGVFTGEPYSFYQRFQATNEYTKWAEGLSFKFKINFITRSPEGKLEAKIFQGGAKVRDALLDAKEEYGLNCAFKIKRSGSGKDDTRYAILYKDKLSKEALDKINEVKLNELKRKTPIEDAEDVFGNGEEDPHY